MTTFVLGVVPVLVYNLSSSPHSSFRAVFYLFSHKWLYSSSRFSVSSLLAFILLSFSYFFAAHSHSHFFKKIFDCNFFPLFLCWFFSFFCFKIFHLHLSSFLICFFFSSSVLFQHLRCVPRHTSAPISFYLLFFLLSFALISSLHDFLIFFLLH